MSSRNWAYDNHKSDTKIIISFNKDLSHEQYLPKNFQKICQIFSDSLLNKTYENYYEYDLKSNSYKKMKINSNEFNSKDNSLIDIYRLNEDNIISQYETKINLFFVRRIIQKQSKNILNWKNIKNSKTKFI